VIEDGDAEERADVDEPLGDGVVLGTRRRVAAYAQLRIGGVMLRFGLCSVPAAALGSPHAACPIYSA